MSQKYLDIFDKIINIFTFEKDSVLFRTSLTYDESQNTHMFQQSLQKSYDLLHQYIESDQDLKFILGGKTQLRSNQLNSIEGSSDFFKKIGLGQQLIESKIMESNQPQYARRQTFINEMKNQQLNNQQNQMDIQNELMQLSEMMKLSGKQDQGQLSSYFTEQSELFEEQQRNQEQIERMLSSFQGQLDEIALLTLENQGIQSVNVNENIPKYNIQVIQPKRPISISKRIINLEIAISKEYQNEITDKRNKVEGGQRLFPPLKDLQQDPPRQQQQPDRFQNPQPVNNKVEIKIKSINQAKMFSEQGYPYTTVRKLQNGKIVAGTTDSKIIVFDQNFLNKKVMDSTDQIRSIIEYGKYVYFCSDDAFMTIYDIDNMVEPKRMTMFQGVITSVTPILRDYLVIGQLQGYIDVIKVTENGYDLLQEGQYKDMLSLQHHSKSTIYDFVKTQRINEYAVATRAEGLSFVQIMKDKDYGQTLIYSDIQDEEYYKKQFVSGVVPIKDDMLLIALDGKSDIEILDRKSKSVVQKINGVSQSGTWCTILPLIGYNDNFYPYVIARDATKVILINTKTFETKDIILHSQSQYRLFYSIHVYQEQNQVKILLLSFDGASDTINKRCIFEYSITNN